VAHRRRGSRPPSRPHSTAEGELSLTQLEQFSELSLKQWKESSSTLQTLQTELFFGLELARQQHSSELIEAIRSNCIAGEPFEEWARIVDYRYCLAPLSVAGSLQSDGGRFNIGAGLNPAAFASFPALYVAQDYPTAYREKFGTAVEDKGRAQRPVKLTSSELALRSPGSFTHVALRGRIELLVDIAGLPALQSFAHVLRAFAVPERVRKLSRKLGLRSPPMLVRSAAGLQRQLLHPNWRINPVQFGLPSNSQVFGRIAVAAGAHGIRYPSARQSGAYCMALFPQNWKHSQSFIEVIGGAPSQATLTRIDGGTSSLQ
jgi:hypothetical protein